MQTWIKFSVTELQHFARKFEEEEEKEENRIRLKYANVWSGVGGEVAWWGEMK